MRQKKKDDINLTLKRVAKITGEIYRKTCNELSYNNERMLILLSNECITEEEYRQKKEAIDTLYCEKICELGTDVLNDILVLHHKGLIKRAPKTLDLIQKELLERTLNEDN